MHIHATNKDIEDLSKALTELNLVNKPNCLWNMDKTSMSSEHTHVNKVVVRKGMRALSDRVADSKQTQTVLATLAAACETMQPLVVVKENKSLYAYKTQSHWDCLGILVKRLHGRFSWLIVVQRGIS